MKIDPFDTSINRYRNEAGDRWIDEDGSSHDTIYSLLQDKVGGCGCGNPDENVDFVGKVLHLCRRDRWDEEGFTYESWRAEVMAILPTSEIEYFVWYWLHEKDFTEHGGSVPGWLTTRGEQLLSDIRQAQELNRNETNG